MIRDFDKTKDWYWGIIDLTEKISDKSRAQECFEITLGSLPWIWIRSLKLTISSNPNIILNNAADSECKYCLLQASGHFVNSYFYKILFNEVEKEEFLIKGHLIDPCIIVNLEIYRNLNRPHFDKLIEESLKNNLTILNFSKEIQTQKWNLYPQIDRHYFAALNNLEEIKTQYKKQIFFWNIPGPGAESCRDYKINESVSTIYCAASGFIPFKIAQDNTIDESTTFVHYDISPAALHFREYQIKHWDGIDFNRFITIYLDSHCISKEEVTFNSSGGPCEKKWRDELLSFGGEKNWLENWYKIKKCHHIFKLVDITEDVAQIIMPERKNSIFWITNCFTYHHCQRNGITKRHNQYLNFINQLQRNNIMWLFGVDHFGRQISRSIIEYSVPNYIKEYDLI